MTLPRQEIPHDLPSDMITSRLDVIQPTRLQLRGLSQAFEKARKQNVIPRR